MTHIVMIACSKQKLDRGAAARDLYQGTLFRHALAWADAYADETYILSAHYLIVPADAWIEPYNLSLNGFTASHRRLWANGVLAEIEWWTRYGHFAAPPAEITMLAGKHYRRYLVEPLREMGYAVHVPLRGLGYGQQVARLKGQCYYLYEPPPNSGFCFCPRCEFPEE